MSTTIDGTCQATLITTVNFLGASELGDTWYTLSLVDREMIIDTKSPAIMTLTDDKLVIVKVQYTLVRGTNGDLASLADEMIILKDQVEFSVKFESLTPKEEELES